MKHQYGYFTRVEYLVVLIIIAIVALIIYGEVSWQRFAQEHHCVRTGERREETYYSYNYDSKGNLTSVVPETVTEYQYSCNDDQLYWH